jgi:hypothetical protein
VRGDTLLVEISSKGRRGGIERVRGEEEDFRRASYLEDGVDLSASPLEGGSYDWIYPTAVRSVVSLSV